MKVVVVGAGVAGPVTALALHRAGVDVVVREAYPVPEREVGSYLTVAPNGLDALRAIEVLDAVRAVAFPTRTNVMLGSTGHELGRLSIGRPLEDGTPALTVKRSVLSATLVAECRRRGIEVRYESRVTGAENEAENENARVTVQFDDSTGESVDLVVGADGVRSSMRRWIAPDSPEARYVGLANFGGITRGAASWSGAEPEAWRFVFGRDAFFGFTPTPGGDVVWFVNEPRGPVSAQERAGTRPQEWSAHLAQLFANDSGPASRLIRDGELELSGDSTYDLGHVPTWHRGGLVVIGDAAHAPAPSSGQGASLAMEDGVVLAQCLRDAHDVGSALETYERVRRARVERIVAAGARSSSSKTPHAVVRPLRDAAMRLVFRFAVTDRNTAWMYDHRIDWERTVQTTAG